MFKYTLLVFTILFISTSLAVNEYARATLKDINKSGIVGSVSFAYDNANTVIQISINNTQALNMLFVILNHGDLTKAPIIDDVYNPTDQPSICNKVGFVRSFNGESVTVTKSSNVWSLSSTNSLVGLAFALFNGSEDCGVAKLQTRSLAQAGNAVSWGVIGIGDTSASSLPSTGPFTSLNSSFPSGALYSTQSNLKYTATCKLVQTPKAQYPIYGTVYFETNADTSQITITAQIVVIGSKGEAHGIHIHSLGDLSVPETSVGGHWKNATGQSHALPNNNTREYGDLGNICIYSGNTAYYKYTTNYFPLVGGNNIIGKSVVIHELRDNGSTFGSRVSWCTIGIRPVSNSPFSIPSSLSIPTPPICLPGSTTTTVSTTSDPSTGSVIISSMGIILLIITMILLF